MNQQEINSLESYSDAQLHDILRNDVTFVESLSRTLPEAVADQAFELFGKDWVRRYWKRLVMEVNGAQASLTSDAALSWAASATAGALATSLAGYFGIPEAAMSACAALAILIIRAARAQQQLADKAPPASEKPAANNKP